MNKSRLAGWRAVWVVVLAALLLAANGRALAQEGGWTTPVMISTNTVSSWFPDVAVDKWGQPYLVYNSGRGTGQEAMDLLMYSALDGLEWLEPNDIAVTAYGGYTVRPAIAVDGVRMLHVTFRGETKVYYTRSPAAEAWNASSWTPRRLISGAGEGTAYYSDIAVDEHGTIHVVWNESVSAGVGEKWMWFGTPKGSAFYDGRGWQTQEPQAGLGDRRVRAIIEDRAGAQWFGTDEGVYRFDGGTWQEFTTQDGLVSQQVNCIAQDLDDRLWFGTDKGVSIYDREAKPGASEWIAYTAGTGLPGNVVHTIAANPFSGEMWVGTDQGVGRFDGDTWTRYTLQDGLPAPEVVAIAVDGQGHVWAGTTQGVSRYDGGRWMTHTVEGGLSSNTVTAIVVDQDGALWFGSERSLSRFDGQDWALYTAGEGLGEGAITALMVDSEGTIWVGTETGVSLYTDGTWEAFELPGEFRDQPVTAIAEDRQVNAICPSCADIFYRHSTDGGRSWSAPRNLSNSFAGSVKPQVRVGGGGKIYVTWEEGEDWYMHGGYAVGAMYICSTDGGNTWNEPTIFSSPQGAPQQITLGLGPADSLVAIWRLAEEESRFYYQLSTDNGTTWSDPVPIPGLLAKSWEAFSLDAYDTATDSAGNVHLLALGYRFSVEEDLGLFHVVWNGSQWSSPVRIYASIDPPEWPVIDIGAGNQVYAAWFTRDEKHVTDSEKGRYKVWVSLYQADAPPLTAAPLPASTPTPASDALEGETLHLTATPVPVVASHTSEFPSGLDTEADEVGQLALALVPAAAIVLLVVAVRLGRLRRSR